MDLPFTEASALAAIDRQIYSNKQDLSPAQYEIVRQVIFHTADFEYISLLKFSEDVLSKGATSLIASIPIVVDVPEIQVSIVPLLQKTFHNPVFCCATYVKEAIDDQGKIIGGLKKIAQTHPQGIYIIGQDENTFAALIELMRDKILEPSFVIATPAMLVEPKRQKFAVDSNIPAIYTANSKGGSTIASAIFKTLINLTWKANQINYSQH